MVDLMLTLLKKDFVRTHENMTDYFASIDPLHPALLQPNNPIPGHLNKSDEE